jgi:AcrR family transcriptional regulator
MPAEAVDSSSKRKRDRARTEERLRKAVVDVLVESGFGALTPSVVAHRAGVDKMLIYRYFGDLPGLVRSIAFAPGFFPTFEDICGDDTIPQMLAMPVAARGALILRRLAEANRNRPAVLEVMVWELVERNALTAIMEEARETMGLKVIETLFPDVADRKQIAAISALLSAGVTYLALRARKIRWYSGIDLKSNEGWAEIFRAAEAMIAGADV